MLIAGLPATGPAQGPGVTGLKERGAELERRSQEVLLDLFALGSRLDRARGELARLDARAAALARRQESARREYRAALETQSNAQLQLGGQLRLLYEHDQPDPIAVILGAASFNAAIEDLDNIKRIAHATDSVLDQAKRAKHRVSRQKAQLAAQVARTKAAHDRVAAGAAELERASSERSAYLSQLRQEQALNNAQIADLQARAAAAQQRAQQVAKVPQQQPAQADSSSTSTSASPPSAPAAPEQTTTFETPSTAAPGEPPPAAVESVSQSSSTGSTASSPGPPKSGGAMSVLVTGYCLTGKTATGLPVGPGIVAVDPSLIPLGTRMTIPGYGEGVAADVGGGVSGAHIDVWVASCSDAASFSRTVTITFL